jgi:hypothetical protein
MHAARLATGGLGARVAGAYVPVRACIEVLGTHTDEAAARKLLGVCLKGARAQQAQWQVRARRDSA